MIKGMSRRVIMVDSPDPELFEKAIFILRDEVFLKKSAGPEEVLRQAERIADDYVRSRLKKKRVKIPPAVYAAAGAGLSGAVCLTLYLLL